MCVLLTIACTWLGRSKMPYVCSLARRGRCVGVPVGHNANESQKAHAVYKRYQTIIAPLAYTMTSTGNIHSLAFPGRNYSKCRMCTGAVWGTKRQWSLKCSLRMYIHEFKTRIMLSILYHKSRTSNSARSSEQVVARDTVHAQCVRPTPVRLQIKHTRATSKHDVFARVGGLQHGHAAFETARWVASAGATVRDRAGTVVDTAAALCRPRSPCFDTDVSVELQECAHSPASSTSTVVSTSTAGSCLELPAPTDAVFPRETALRVSAVPPRLAFSSLRLQALDTAPTPANVLRSPRGRASTPYASAGEPIPMAYVHGGARWRRFARTLCANSAPPDVADLLRRGSGVYCYELPELCVCQVTAEDGGSLLCNEYVVVKIGKTEVSGGGYLKRLNAELADVRKWRHALSTPLQERVVFLLTGEGACGFERSVIAHMGTNVGRASVDRERSAATLAHMLRAEPGQTIDAFLFKKRWNLKVCDGWRVWLSRHGQPPRTGPTEFAVVHRDVVRALREKIEFRDLDSVKALARAHACPRLRSVTVDFADAAASLGPLCLNVTS